MNSSSVTGRRQGRFGRTTALTAASAAVVLGLTACGTSSGGGSTNGTGSIPVAFVGELTGTGTSFGVSLKGAQAVVAEINQSGGINGRKLKVVGTYDTQSTAAGGTTAAQQALGKNPAMIFQGSISAGTTTAAAVFARAKIPVFDVSGGEDVMKPILPLHFSLNLEASQAAKATVDEAKHNLPGIAKPKVALAGAISPAVDGHFAVIKKMASSSGIQVVAEERVPIPTTSFTSQAAKIVRAKADAVIDVDATPNTVLEVKSLRTAGFTGPIVTEGGPADDDTFKALADPNFFALRTAKLAAPGSQLAKIAESANAGTDAARTPYFALGYAAMYSEVMIYKACGKGCTSATYQHKAETLGPIKIPNDAFYGPVEFGPDHHWGVTNGQYFVWNVSKKEVQPNGPKTSV